MSGVASIAGRRGAPAPRCAACAEALGCAVAFCPFCGTAQAVARPAPAALPPVQPAAPAMPPPAVPLPPARPPLAGKGLPAAKPPAPVTAAPTAPAPAATAPAPQPAPAAARPPRAAPRRSPWKRLAVLAAAGFLAFAYLRGERAPPPGATLVVQVRAPNGGAVTSGRILVDGTPAGTPGESLRVPPGSHGVAFEDPGWQSEPRPVTLARDASLTLTLTAREAPARVSVASRPPGALVRLHGRSLGRTPVDLTLDPGSTELSVTLDGYAAKTVPLTLARGEARSLTLDLAEAPPATALAPRTQPPPFDRGVLTAITALQAAPSRTAEAAGTLPSLSEVQVLAQVNAEDTWLQVRAGGHQGYIRSGSGIELWEGWSQRHVLSGPIEAVTPGLGVVVGGTAAALAGIRPPDGPPGPGAARVLQALGSMVKGQPARCVPHDTATYVCKTADARDVAELYLMNGGAVVAAGALPYYFDAQRIAQERQKGLWSD